VPTHWVKFAKNIIEEQQWRARALLMEQVLTLPVMARNVMPMDIMILQDALMMLLTQLDIV